MRDESVTVNKGDRIGQAVVVQVQKPNMIRVPEMNTEDRGGFGSTN